MGIERFFSSIEGNKITNSKEGFSKDDKEKIRTKFFYIDFNSIIHIVSQQVIQNINTLLFSLIFNNEKKADKMRLELDISKDVSKNTDTLKKHFNDHELHLLIINKVKQYVFFLLDNFIDKKYLKLLYISIDGVPSRAKMADQRKRRYNGVTIGSIKQKIFNKHKKELQKHKLRYEYEINKFSFNKSLISPGTQFMNMLNDDLKNQEFQMDIKNELPSLDTFIFSGVYDHGEGEKKIVNHFISIEDDKTSCLIFSPDSDVILLILLMRNIKPLSQFKMLRHNQQRNNYAIININLLADNIFEYINKKTSGNFDKRLVLDDIVFLLSIFGNDFIPKIEAFDVKNDFTKMIEIYIKSLSGGYIIEQDRANKRKKINGKNFLNIVKLLQFDEGGNLQKKYVSSNYANHKKLKKTFQEDGTEFIPNVIKFLSNLNKFHNDIRKGMDIEELSQRWDSQDWFLNILNKISQTKKSSTRDTLILYIYNEYKETNKIPKVNIKFVKYPDSLESSRHSSKCEKKLDYLDPSLQLLDYDKEIYEFDNMIGSYIDKLNIGSLELGEVYIDQQTYTWKSKKLKDEISGYYKKYFDIGSLDIKNKKMSKAVTEYLMGMMWVFDYYYNSYDDIKSNSTWFYPYTKAPLMTQIYYHIREYGVKVLEKILDDVRKMTVDSNEYFNSLEHFMFVTPLSVTQNLIPKEFKTFVKESGFYPDMNEVFNKIWLESGSDDKNIEFDCKGVPYLSKCVLKVLKNKSYNDIKFLEQIRKVKLEEMTKILQGSVVDRSPNIKRFYKRVKIGKIRQTDYQKYKKLYKESGVQRYKYLYKLYKKVSKYQ
jgi:5'-3' exonuclease